VECLDIPPTRLLDFLKDNFVRFGLCLNFSMLFFICPYSTAALDQTYFLAFYM
jgi:hypothetical protein